MEAIHEAHQACCAVRWTLFDLHELEIQSQTARCVLVCVVQHINHSVNSEHCLVSYSIDHIVLNIMVFLVQISWFSADRL